MAIAGFTDDKNSLWREMAQTNCPNLDDPYIRAIFAFLTESDSNYETILVSILYFILYLCICQSCCILFTRYYVNYYLL